MAVNEWHTRKIGIDVMYTIAAILGDVLMPYTKEILEVLNHCRFDKMKPVREAAIEAINLIKEIDPGAEESASQDSFSRKDKTPKAPQQNKPWKKKSKTQKIQEESVPFSKYSNKDEDDDVVEKKISNATKKRLEALEAKRKAQPTKKPNLNKEKKSIFELQKNSAFFGKNRPAAQTEVHIKPSNDSKRESIGNFKKNKHFEDTPDFNEAGDRLSEEEKRMDLSNDKSHGTSEKNKSIKKKPIIVYNLAEEDDDQEDEEAVPLRSNEKSQNKFKKHKFNATYDDQYDQRDDIEVLEKDEGIQKVEETPEEHNTDEKNLNDEQDFVVKEKPRTTPSRTYKAWERKTETYSETQPVEESDPEQQYSTIAERIKNRNKLKQQEYEKQKRQEEEMPTTYEEHHIIEQEVVENIDQSSNKMMNRLQNLHNQCNDIETNMDKMMNSSKNYGNSQKAQYPDQRNSHSTSYYHQNADRQDAVRHTISIPSSSYNYSQREDLSGRRDGEYSFEKSGNQQTQNQNQGKIRASHFDLPTKTIDLESISPSQRAYDNTPSSRRNEDNAQVLLLREELRFMRIQQDKILENQNIFQTYISNEITNIKNKINQMEGDIILSKTMSGSLMMRNDMSQF